MAAKRDQAKWKAIVNVLNGLIAKAKDAIERETFNGNKIIVLLDEIKTKITSVDNLNEKIIDQVDEKDIEAEIEQATQADITIRWYPSYRNVHKEKCNGWP